MAKLSEIQEVEDQGTEIAAWTPDTRVCVLFISLTMASLVVAIDATVLVTILPIICAELQGSVSDAFWTITVYLLASAVSQPVFSALVNNINLRILVAVSLALFSAGSALCAQAANFPVLLAGRAIKGTGGGGIVSLVQVSFAREVPREQRPKWFSLILCAWAVGTVAGPFIGSGLAKLLDYQWVFWINIPLNWISFCLLPWTAPSQDWVKQPRLEYVDWVGCLLFTTSTTSFLMGVTWGGTDFPWNDFRTILPIILGGVGLMLTGCWEHRFAKVPFFSNFAFQPMSLALTHLSAFLQGLTLYCALYYIPLYFTTVRLRTPLASSVLLLPLSCSMLPVSAISSQLIASRRQFQWAMCSGWLCVIAGAAHLTLFDQHTTNVHMGLILCLLGSGCGMTLSAINFAVQAIPTTNTASFAASTYTFMRSLGMCLGVAIGSNIFQVTVRRRLETLGIDDKLMDSIFEQSGKHMDQSSLTLNRVDILQALCYGLHNIYWTMVGIGVTGLACAIFIKDSKATTKTE